MRNKKNYNCLFDSIISTIFLIASIGLYSISLWFGVINAKEGTNSILLLIVLTVFFGLSIIFLIFVIIIYCYDYWILLDDSIIYKKLFLKEKRLSYQKLKE